MRIVLFFPRGKGHVPGVSDIGHLAALLPPLGILSIAAVLRKNGHTVAVFDAAFENNVTNDQWASRIIRWKPDYVGFSANTVAFLDACDVCKRVKQHDPDIRTIFGGVHVSWGKEIILEKFEAVDYVIAGEGEDATERLLDGDAPETIPGLFFRNGSRIESGPPQTHETLCKLDNLPFPAYDMLPGFPKRYYLPLFSYHRNPGTHIISSRGCTYQCSFCDRSVFGRTFRWNSPEYTVELISYLNRDFGIRHVYFYDDLFTMNRARVAALCSLLEKSRARVMFNCIVRIGHIDKELIGMLKAGGCWMVNVGIESGDQKILDSFKDGLTVEKIRRDVQQLYDAGIHVKGLFMMGFPGETVDSIEKTFNLAFSLPLKDANMTAFTPFPGAPVTRTIHEQGVFLDDWEKMDCMNFVFQPTTVPSKEILERYYSEFYRRFYQRPFMRGIYRKMVFDSPHSYWRLAKHFGSFFAFTRSMQKNA